MNSIRTNGTNRLARLCASVVLTLTIGIAIASAIVPVSPALALIREGSAGRSDLSFSRMAYFWDHLEVSITNRTKQNVIFGGTMIFTDRHGRPVARAEVLSDKIKRNSTRRFRANFTLGSGEEASAAWGLIWDLNQRNN